MSIKDITLEELIVKHQENKAERLFINTENIKKLEKRVSVASGAEKQRLQNLVELHKSETVKIEAIDPVAIANEKFEKLK